MSHLSLSLLPIAREDSIDVSEYEELIEKNRILEAKNSELKETIRKITRNYQTHVAQFDPMIAQLREELGRRQNEMYRLQRARQMDTATDCLSGAAIGAVVATIVTLPLSIFIAKVTCP